MNKSASIRNSQQTLKLKIELDADDALQLAQFCKRVSFSDFRSNACNDDEAYAMRHAMSVIREHLNRAGFDPR